MTSGYLIFATEQACGDTMALLKKTVANKDLQLIPKQGDGGWLIAKYIIVNRSIREERIFVGFV